MLTTPKVRLTSSSLAAAIPLSVPRDEIQEAMGPALQELHRTVKKEKAALTGPWFTHHTKISADRFELEVCLPLEKQVSPRGRVKTVSFPSIQVVESIYQGDYEGLGEAWEAFLDRIKKDGYKTKEDMFEFYLVGPDTEDDPNKWQTRLCKPLREGS
ncbi:MAG: GyrI-like domain-containing protein [Nibricoccus sp.]